MDTPRPSRRYRVTLLFPDGATVPGTPVYFALSPGASAAAHSAVSGPGRSSCITGLETYIYVHTADVSGGATECDPSDVSVTVRLENGTSVAGAVSAPGPGRLACSAEYTGPMNGTHHLVVDVAGPPPPLSY